MLELYLAALVTLNYDKYFLYCNVRPGKLLSNQLYDDIGQFFGLMMYQLILVVGHNNTETSTHDIIFMTRGHTCSARRCQPAMSHVRRYSKYKIEYCFFTLIKLFGV